MSGAALLSALIVKRFGGLVLLVLVIGTVTVAPSAGAVPLSGPGDEICQVLGDNGGTYFLSVTSRRDNDLSECSGGTPLQADIDDLLGNPKYGPNVDRRCIYDMTTDPTVDAIVGVYSSGRDIDRVAARTICQLHHGTN
jgi:hypothetical protein